MIVFFYTLVVPKLLDLLAIAISILFYFFATWQTPLNQQRWLRAQRSPKKQDIYYRCLQHSSACLLK